MAAGQMRPDPVSQSPHLAGDLDEAFAQDVDLHPGGTLPAEPTPERVQGPVGRGMQQQSELAGPEREQLRRSDVHARLKSLTQSLSRRAPRTSRVSAMREHSRIRHTS